MGKWCRWAHTAPAPADPAAVAGYLAEQAHAGRSLSRVNVLLAAIKHGHRSLGHDLHASILQSPQRLQGSRATISAPVRQATPLEIGDLHHIIAAIVGKDIRSLRDRALILLGFHGALRRSELVSLDMQGRSYVEIKSEGLLLHLTATKGSTKTQTIAVTKRNDELCAETALVDYLAASELEAGPMFRAVSKAGRLLDRRLDPSSVGLILRDRAADCPQVAKAFSAHVSGQALQQAQRRPVHRNTRFKERRDIDPPTPCAATSGSPMRSRRRQTAG